MTETKRARGDSAGLPYWVLRSGLCHTEREGEARATATSAAPDSDPTLGHSRPSPGDACYRVNDLPLASGDSPDPESCTRIAGTRRGEQADRDCPDYSPPYAGLPTPVKGLAWLVSGTSRASLPSTRLQARRSCGTGPAAHHLFIRPNWPATLNFHVSNMWLWLPRGFSPPSTSFPHVWHTELIACVSSVPALPTRFRFVRGDAVTS